MRLLFPFFIVLCYQLILQILYAKNTVFFHFSFPLLFSGTNLFPLQSNKFLIGLDLFFRTWLFEWRIFIEKKLSYLHVHKIGLKHRQSVNFNSLILLMNILSQSITILIIRETRFS